MTNNGNIKSETIRLKRPKNNKKRKRGGHKKLIYGGVNGAPGGVNGAALGGGAGGLVKTPRMLRLLLTNRLNYLEVEGEQNDLEDVLDFALDVAHELDQYNPDDSYPEIDVALDVALDVARELEQYNSDDIPQEVNNDTDGALDAIFDMVDEITKPEPDTNNDTDGALDAIFDMVDDITKPETDTNNDTDEALDAIFDMVDEITKPIDIPGERPINFEFKIAPRGIMDSIGKTFGEFKNGLKNKLDSMYSDKDPTKYEVEEYARVLVDEQNKTKHNLRKFTYDSEGLQSQSVIPPVYEHQWLPQFALGSDGSNKIQNIDYSTKSIDDKQAEVLAHSHFAYDSSGLNASASSSNQINQHKWQEKPNSV